jgi:hypothetical protein
MKLESGKYVGTQCGSVYQLTAEAVDWNGSHFGCSVECIDIWEFLGTTRIVGLVTPPLNFHPQEEETREVLVQRGKAVEELAGCHYKEYDGFAVI